MHDEQRQAFQQLADAMNRAVIDSSTRPSRSISRSARFASTICTASSASSGTRTLSSHG